MNFLITGGLGYIGQVLQQELSKKGHYFTIVDNDLLNLHNWKQKIDITNYNDFNFLSNLIQNSDVVVNLAAIVGDQACLVDTRLAIEINCRGMQHLTNLCNKLGKKIIHVSTCSIYGEGSEVLTEESQTFPVDFYGQTKFQQERFLLENGKKFCVLRLGTAYGWSPRMRFDLVMNLFTAKVYNKEKLTVFGGEQWRPIVHIRDISRAIIFAAEQNLEGIYNLANENLRISDVAQIIAQGKVAVETNEQMADPRNYKVDNSRIMSKGFVFEWNLKKGVEDMQEHPQDLAEYKNARYSNYKQMVMKKLQATT